MVNGIVRLLLDGIALVGVIGIVAALVQGHQPRQEVAVLERPGAMVEGTLAVPRQMPSLPRVVEASNR